MKLHELLAQHPAAKVEHDEAVSAAFAGGETAGKSAIMATINKVSPFLASTEYPAVIGKTAIAVLKGEESVVALTSAVAAVDAVREDAKAKGAAAATTKQPATPAPGVPVAHVPGEVVATQEGLDAEIARLKEGGN